MMDMKRLAVYFSLHRITNQNDNYYVAQERINSRRGAHNGELIDIELFSRAAVHGTK